MTIAVVVVMVLFIVLVLAIVLAVVIAVMMRRKRAATESYSVEDTGLAIDGKIHDVEDHHFLRSNVLAIEQPQPYFII